MDKSLQTIGIVAVPGVALVVMIWAGWSVLPSPAAEPDCTVGYIAPGRYDLEVVAREGSKGGTTAIGTIRLRCVTKADISYEGCRPLAHLVGFAELDFASVGAPVANRAHRLVNDETPIWAGVMVYTLDEDQFTLVSIQTVATPRFACMAADGDGIGMLVKEASPDRTAGTWNPSGLYEGGSGTFTMRYIGPE